MVFSLVSFINYSLSVGSVGSTLPPVIGHGLSVSSPVGHGWSYMGEVTLTTGLVELHPGVQLLTGPVKKIDDGFSLGVTALYKFVPSFDSEVPSGHVVGVSIVPIIPMDFGAVSFPTGLAFVPATDTLIVGTNVKISLRL